MSDAVTVALITGGLATLSNVVVAIMNSRLMIYRIEQLEKKQDKYNNLQERTTILEANDKAQWKYIDQFKEEFDRR